MEHPAPARISFLFAAAIPSGSDTLLFGLPH
jgi:hypothetical protein